MTTPLSEVRNHRKNHGLQYKNLMTTTRSHVVGRARRSRVNLTHMRKKTLERVARDALCARRSFRIM